MSKINLNYSFISIDDFLVNKFLIERNNISLKNYKKGS